MYKSILMISESPYPEDVRIKHEAETLFHAGHPVTIIALNEQKARFTEVINGVKVYRLPMITLFPKSSSEHTFFGRLLFRLTSGAGYVLEYVYFTVLSFVFSLYVYARHGFDIVHLHNPPNTLVLVAGFYKLLGKLFVFDHHDLAPELYLSKYRIEKPDLLYKLLRLEEIACLKLADMVIATNRSYAEIEVRRGQIKESKITIVRNGPDLDIFHQVPPDVGLKQSGRQILVYVGIMGPQDGVDYLLEALAHLVHDLIRRNVFCIVIGKGDALANLQHLAHELMLDDHVWFTGFIPRGDLLRYLSTADICLDPNPSSPLSPRHSGRTTSESPWGSLGCTGLGTPTPIPINFFLCVFLVRRHAAHSLATSARVPSGSVRTEWSSALYVATRPRRSVSATATCVAPISTPRMLHASSWKLAGPAVLTNRAEQPRLVQLDTT